jgi:hypothetical protein
MITINSTIYNHFSDTSIILLNFLHPENIQFINLFENGVIFLHRLYVRSDFGPGTSTLHEYLTNAVPNLTKDMSKL